MCMRRKINQEQNYKKLKNTNILVESFLLSGITFSRKKIQCKI